MRRATPQVDASDDVYKVNGAVELTTGVAAITSKGVAVVTRLWWSDHPIATDLSYDRVWI